MPVVQRASTDQLKEKALSLGFSGVGVCPATRPPHIDAYNQWLSKGYHGEMQYLQEHAALKTHPSSLLPSVQSVIAVALNYNQPDPYESGTPRVARYALGRDYHKVLGSKLKQLERWLSAEYPDAEFRRCVDSAPIMERDFAQLAGLGWFGKNTCLINSKRGSWFFIGLLLTSLPFVPDQPAIGSCGTCRKCIDACPTGAIVHEDDRWQVDARTCISYLTIEYSGQISPVLAEGLGEWTFGCDVCQEVCPFNQPRPAQPERGVPTTEEDFKQKRVWPSLVELATINREDWDRLTRGSAMRRVGYEGLKRNAQINLGNSRVR